MKNIFSLIAIIVAVMAHEAVAEAQQAKKVARVGYLASAGSPGGPSLEVETLKQGLRELGYIEGQNVLTVTRYAEGRLDRMPGLVNELVQLKVDVIV